MLLQLLRIKNLALVEDLEWEIAPGFTAITGETGAGKSIIIGALQLLLGERADKSFVRTGAEMCTVEAAREQELDLLRHQVNEIASANLSAEEEAQIESRYRLASNSRRLIEIASAVATKLSEMDEAILSQLGETQKLLHELEKLDPSMATVANTHETAVVELSEIARDLSRYAENLDLDPEQLTAIEQRISLFESLKRKYGTTISEVIAFGEGAAERMRKIERRDEELQRLTNEIATRETDLRQAGERLRKLRTKAAPKLSEMV